MQALPPDQCVNLQLAQAERLGVEVRWLQAASGGSSEGHYVAQPSRPGLLQLRTAEPTRPTAALCNLVTHEMVHVLQHWRGELQAVLPLGWPIDEQAAAGRSLSRHEAEAFTAQEQPERVLRALQRLQPLP